jgi:hypothetical protein
VLDDFGQADPIKQTQTITADPGYEAPGLEDPEHATGHPAARSDEAWQVRPREDGPLRDRGGDLDHARARAPVLLLRDRRAASGSLMLIQVPLPMRDLASILPPWAFTISRAT